MLLYVECFLPISTAGGGEVLVLARKVGQSIVINDNIEILIIEVRGDQVRLGIEADRNIPVHRKELLEQIRAENAKAAGETVESGPAHV